jgi:maleate isomerase
MAQPDNWGWQARIGIFIVGNEAVPEAEWWAMAPPNVSIHAARVTARAPWATWNPTHTAVTLEDDLARGARQFATMRLSAITVGHTSSSILGGPGWDEATITALAELIPSTFLTTNGLDCLAALKASHASRPFLVLPPWFNDATVAAALAYYRHHTIEPAGHLRYDPGRKWRDLPPADLYPNGMGFEQEIEPLYAQIIAACPPQADSILIGGTGFRCIGILDALETNLKRPTLSANQASLWNCLRHSNVHTPIPNYGSLLRL